MFLRLFFEGERQSTVGGFWIRPVRWIVLWCISLGCAAVPPVEKGVPTAHCPAADRSNPTEELLRRLLVAYWEEAKRADPFLASFAGDRRYNHLLPQVSLEDIDQRAQSAQGFLAQLNEIDRRELGPDRRVDFDVLKWSLENALSAYRHQLYLLPYNHIKGFHLRFSMMVNQLPFETVADFENYISRMKQFPRYVEQNIGLMKRGVEQGIVLPRVVLESRGQSIGQFVVDRPEQSLFYKPFVTYRDKISRGEYDRLVQEGTAAIRSAVVPGFLRLQRFVAEEYLPAGRKTIGASQLPGGPSVYQFWVREHTSTPKTPDEIHHLGLAEVERIYREMGEVAQKVGFSGSTAEFARSLAQDPRFKVGDVADWIQGAAALMKRVDVQLPQYFAELPRIPVGIEPAGDGSRAGMFYVNGTQVPLYDLTALTLHETVPGHHLQMALQFEKTEMAGLRRYTYSMAFMEGWALYAEWLGFEMGLYDSPYDHFGRLNQEMLRACRLVVDTGMHAKGWRRQQAIDYLARYTTSDEKSIEGEIDRYIAWPGQALAYKIGELKIRELRTRAAKQLGADFDIRAFHDKVLAGGALPLNVLETVIEDWIQAKLTQGKPSAS